MAQELSRRLTTRTTISNDVSLEEPKSTRSTRLSLCTLPLDILLQIIDYISLHVKQETVDLASDRLARASVVSTKGQSSYINFLHDQTPILNSLQSLGSVNRMLYQLCRPRLWGDFHFPTLASIPIGFYIENIFPDQGSFITKLSFKLSTEACCGPRLFTYQPIVPQVYDNTTKTSFPLGPGPVGPAPYRYRAHHDREPLSAESALQLVSLCPNLQSLTINLPTIQSTIYHERYKKILEALLLSLVPYLKGLQELLIHQGASLPMPEQCMSKVICQLPLLRSLSLSNITNYSSQTKDSESLGWNLAQLQHLTKLRLCCTNIVHEKWCDYSWPKSIKELRLETCYTLSLKTAHRLIHSMAPNVIRLGVGYGHNEIQLGVRHGLAPGQAGRFDHQYDLPRLTDLTLEILIPPELTSCFKNCKDLCRLTYMHATMDHWRVLTGLGPRQTWPHLKCINLPGESVGRIPPLSNVSEAFKETCDKEGIGFCD